VQLSWAERMEKGCYPEGAITELSLSRGVAGATALALRACAGAQAQAVREGGRPALCGFVDPGRTLYAPGVQARGVHLDRLVVAAPEPERLAQTILRMAEARVFSVLVVDLVGGWEAGAAPQSWVRLVRKIGQTIEGTPARVLLLTDEAVPLPLPLPVQHRIELYRKEPRAITVRVARSQGSPASAGFPLSSFQLTWGTLRRVEGPGLHAARSQGERWGKDRVA
jgi:recA bacterial DNA recombination protein